MAPTRWAHRPWLLRNRPNLCLLHNLLYPLQSLRRLQNRYRLRNLWCRPARRRMPRRSVHPSHPTRTSPTRSFRLLPIARSPMRNPPMLNPPTPLPVRASVKRGSCELRQRVARGVASNTRRASGRHGARVRGSEPGSNSYRRAQRTTVTGRERVGLRPRAGVGFGAATGSSGSERAHSACRDRTRRAAADLAGLTVDPD